MEFKKCFDGFIKITIPGIGVTWARDLEDAQVAIAEALEAHRLIINQFASVSEKEILVFDTDLPLGNGM